MSDEQSFQELMARLRAGDEQAAARIFEQFARRLVGLARGRLAQSHRAKEDPEDIVQSSLGTFFRHQAEGQYHFGDWHDLWNLLAAITVRKCGDRIDYYRAAKRDTAREAEPLSTADSAALWQPLTREPTPSEALMLIEVAEQLMRSLSERDRRILELSLQGMKPQYISEQLVCSECTVERVLERIRKDLEQWNEP